MIFSSVKSEVLHQGCGLFLHSLPSLGQLRASWFQPQLQPHQTEPGRDSQNALGRLWTLSRSHHPLMKPFSFKGSPFFTCQHPRSSGRGSLLLECWKSSGPGLSWAKGQGMVTTASSLEVSLSGLQSHWDLLVSRWSHWRFLEPTLELHRDQRS